MNDPVEFATYVSSPSGDVDRITITIQLPPHLAGLPLLRTAAYCVRRVIGLLLLVRTSRASLKHSG